jgi:hypothetical protein
VSIWGSDLTLDAKHPAGAPYADCMDAAGFYATGDRVVTARRTEGGWLDVATQPGWCHMVRLIVSADDRLGVAVFLDEPQVRAVRDELTRWLDTLEASR